MMQTTRNPLPSNLQKLAKFKQILLLQGPVGHFFQDLASFLAACGAKIHKINFNGGDEYFYRSISSQTTNYTDKPENFAAFLQNFVSQNQIDAIVCFGDTRFYHQIAKTVCSQQNISFWAFEEGYFRPYWITLCQQGVNDYSPLPRKANFYLNAFKQFSQQSVKAPKQVPTGFMRMAWCAMRYYWAMHKTQTQFPHYIHHRSSSLSYYIQSWWRAFYRKAIYAFKERNVAKNVINGHYGRFFIVPLQVATDSQVRIHSDFRDVRHFLLHTLSSFAQHAPNDTSIIIKHHPMDRGFTDYTRDIDRFLRQNPQLKSRVHYVHDVPLPIFLRYGAGMIAINSTSGLSALLHKMPVKILGRANYDFKGLTSQQSLPDFWQNPTPPDADLFHAYRMFHLNITQINGSFYSHANLSLTQVKNRI